MRRQKEIPECKASRTPQVMIMKNKNKSKKAAGPCAGRHRGRILHPSSFASSRGTCFPWEKRIGDGEGNVLENDFLVDVKSKEGGLSFIITDYEFFIIDPFKARPLIEWNLVQCLTPGYGLYLCCLRCSRK